MELAKELANLGAARDADAEANWHTPADNKFSKDILTNSYHNECYSAADKLFHKTKKAKAKHLSSRPK
jgi:hypothetical protein